MSVVTQSLTTVRGSGPAWEAYALDSHGSVYALRRVPVTNSVSAKLLRHACLALIAWLAASLTGCVALLPRGQTATQTVGPTTSLPKPQSNALFPTSRGGRNWRPRASIPTRIRQSRSSTIPTSLRQEKITNPVTRFDPFTRGFDDLFTGMFLRPVRFDIDAMPERQTKQDVTESGDTCPVSAAWHGL
jgi:hypothetical protein